MNMKMSLFAAAACALATEVPADSLNVWTARSSGTTNTLSAITYSCGLFTAVGANGTILHSPDGVRWNPSISETTERLNGVTYGSGRFVAIGDNGTILVSADAVNWVNQNSGTTSPLLG